MSIIKISDNKYRIFVSDGVAIDGRRKRLSKTFITDLKGRDLDRFLRQAELDFETEVLDSSITYSEMSNETFSNFLNWWLDYKQLTPQSKQSYEHNLRYIEKYIGHKKLNNIKQSDILELMDIIKNKTNSNTGGSISDRTIRNHLNNLKSVFATATELEILKDNPTKNVKFTVSESQTDNYYDIDDINQMIIKLNKQAPPVYKLAIILTLATGLRIGELLALEESDFNRKEHFIIISKALSEVKGSKSIGPTKNKKTRTKYYPVEIEYMLDEHLELDKLKKESVGIENNLIFTSQTGDFMPKKTIQCWFNNFIKKNNLKHITFHGLRHTSATILLAKGIPLKNVSEGLGHSRTSTTVNIYAHAIPSIDKESATVFSEILSTGSRSGSRDQNLRIIK